jgi:predicted transcriptional regulator
MKQSVQPMKQIRLRINDLLDQHEDSVYHCKGCGICTEIKKLSKQLFSRGPAEKFKYILAKGQDMTKSEITLLLENDVTVADIRKAVGISNTDFSNMLINYGLTQRRNKKEVEKEMAKITLEEYQDLSNRGITDAVIAKRFGIKQPAICYYKKKWATEAVQPAEEEVKPSETKPTQEDKTAEYEAVIKQLKTKLEEKENWIDELQETVSRQQKGLDEYKKSFEEKENLNAACEDVENELASLRDENARLVKQGHHNSYIISNQKYQLEKWAMENEALEEENKALKYFARKYLA